MKTEKQKNDEMCDSCLIEKGVPHQLIIAGIYMIFDVQMQLDYAQIIRTTKTLKL